MFLKKSVNNNNKVYLSFVQGYRDENGKVKQRTIQKLGYLEDLEKEYDDPISHFKEVAKETNDNTIKKITINNIDTKTINEDSIRKNLGYVILKYIYNEIGFDKFFKKIQKNLNIEYSLDDILQLLVYSRILYPGSKKETFENKDRFFENFNFSLKDIYKSLDHFPNYKDEIETLLWESTKDSYERDSSTTFYDCTNYYFEISYNDRDLVDEEGNVLEKNYRKKGPSKEHRKTPIIQMGLLMDNNGIPLSYNLFPGNESEKTTLLPAIKNIKKNFSLDRIIVVADRGLNTSDNTVFIAGKNQDGNHMDGYIYGQSVLGADKKFKDWVLEQNYTIDENLDDNGNKITFIHKSRIFAKTVHVKKDDKRTVKYDIYQKQMVYYSEKYANKQKKERELILEKAKDLINNPGRYTKATSYGAAKYINNIKFDKETGEIPDGLQLTLKESMIEEESKYDGYYSIVTSELKMSDKELRDKYKNLWKIEDTFKVTKSTLEARPVYVWTKEHIEAHFLTCFVSLVILRLLEKKLENKLKKKYSPTKIINSLKEYSCSNIEYDYYLFDHYDEIIKGLELIIEKDLTRKYLSLSEIKNILKK